MLKSFQTKKLLEIIKLIVNLCIVKFLIISLKEL